MVHQMSRMKYRVERDIHSGTAMPPHVSNLPFRISVKECNVCCAYYNIIVVM